MILSNTFCQLEVMMVNEVVCPTHFSVGTFTVPILMFSKNTDPLMHDISRIFKVSIELSTNVMLIELVLDESISIQC